MTGGRKVSVLDVYSSTRYFSSLSGTNFVSILPPTTAPATSINLRLFNSLPATVNMLTIDASGNIAFQAIPSGGGGGVTSFALDAATDTVFGVTNSTTTPTLSFDSQSANRFLASPSGAAGTPTMRTIDYSDLSSLVGQASSTLAAGNDNRFHTQGTDTGTTNATFSLDSDAASPILLKNASGVLQIRNSGDTANADLTLANLTVSGNLTVAGTSTVTIGETITFDDNILVLNNNFTTGTPTENAGLAVKRGSSVDAELTWDESIDSWSVGVTGTVYPIVRRRNFGVTNANLTSGVATVTHNLGNQYPSVQIYDNNGDLIGAIDRINAVNTNSFTADFTSFVAANGGTLPGTWVIAVQG